MSIGMIDRSRCADVAEKMTMKRILCGYLLAGIAFILTWPSSTTAVSSPLVMGIFPRREATETVRMFTPLAKYLSTRLKREVVLRTEKDFQAFWIRVQSGHYDIVHYNQFHYVHTRKRPGYGVIAKNEEFGQSTIAGSIVVRADSGIKTIKDLTGKKIVFGGGKKAMQSYIIASYLLKKGGLNKGDYIENFATSPPNAVLAIYFRQAAAAGVGDVVLKLNSVTANANVNNLIFLARGRPLAHLPWAVRTRLPALLKQRIQRVLITMRQNKLGQEALKSARLTNIVKANDKEYNPHRRIIKIITGRSY